MISALRPHQWVKNILVALPAVALHRFDPVLVLFAFVSFSMAASAVYLCNDLADIAADRKHPRKRKRAIASGAMPAPFALWLAGALLVPSIGLAIMLGRGFAVALGLYLLLAGLYNYLKQVIILDVGVLTMLYGLRVWAGAEATNIELSHWLIAFCLFLFLCLALIKRVGEITTGNTFGRAYSSADLTVMSGLMTASGFTAMLVLALYIDSASLLYHHHERLWWLCGLLLYWFSHLTVMAGRGKMNDDPIVFVLTDPASWVVGILTAVIFWAAI